MGKKIWHEISLKYFNEEMSNRKQICKLFALEKWTNLSQQLNVKWKILELWTWNIKKVIYLRYLYINACILEYNSIIKSKDFPILSYQHNRNNMIMKPILHLNFKQQAQNYIYRFLCSSIHMFINYIWIRTMPTLFFMPNKNFNLKWTVNDKGRFAKG